MSHWLTAWNVFQEPQLHRQLNITVQSTPWTMTVVLCAPHTYKRRSPTGICMWSNVRVQQISRLNSTVSEVIFKKKSFLCFSWCDAYVSEIASSNWCQNRLMPTRVCLSRAKDSSLDRYPRENIASKYAWQHTTAEHPVAWLSVGFKRKKMYFKN